MGGFTQLVRSALLNHYFGKSTLVPPTIYVGLSTTTPTTLGVNVTEPPIGTNGYARVATAASDWDLASNGDPCILDNAQPISFPPASGDWLSGQDFVSAILFDAATGGNVIGFGALSVQKPVTSGDIAEYQAGAIDITLNGV